MRTKNTSPTKKVNKKTSGKKPPDKKQKNKNEDVTPPPPPPPPPEYRVKASLLGEQGVTLQEFLTGYMVKIYALRRKLKFEEVQLVCWKYEGPELLKIPQRYQELVQTIVSSSKPFYAHGTNERETPKELEGSLADHLFFFRDRLPTVIKDLRFVDPVGDGNCGYYTLQLIGMFLYLEEAPPEPHLKVFYEALMDQKKMRQDVKDILLQDIDFYRESKGMLLSFRPDDISDHDWETGGMASFGVCQSDDLVISNQHESDSLLNGVTYARDILNHGVSPYFEMDQRHLEVFARSTKTRIVFLKYSLLKDSFVCYEYDWRTSPENCSYSTEIPTFDYDYDFYRTAVVTHSRTSKRIEEEELIFSNSMHHFSLWIPENYQKRFHVRQWKESSNAAPLSPKVPRKKNSFVEPSDAPDALLSPKPSPKVPRKKKSLVEPSDAPDAPLSPKPSPKVPRKKKSLVDPLNEASDLASNAPLSPKVPKRKKSLVGQLNKSPDPKVPRKQQSSEEIKVTALNERKKQEQKDAGKKDQLLEHDTEETNKEVAEESVPKLHNLTEDVEKTNDSKHDTEETHGVMVPEVHDFINDYNKEDYGGEYKEQEGGGLDGIVVPTIMMGIAEESYQPGNDIFDDIVLDLPTANVSTAETNEGDVEPTIRHARNWLDDTSNFEYEGSSEWLLVDWFTTGANFQLWRNPGKRRKDDIQAELAHMINKDGLDNHRVHRGRNKKGVGEHINSMFRKMTALHQKIKVEKDKGCTKEEGEVLSQSLRYYNMLYPTMKNFLDNPPPGKKKAATFSNEDSSTSEVKPEYSVELKDQETLGKVSNEARRHNEVLEELERQKKESEVQFKHMENFKGYQEKGFSLKQIARINKAYILFFPEENLSEEDKKEYEKMYNEWLRSNNKIADFKF